LLKYVAQNKKGKKARSGTSATNIQRKTKPMTNRTQAVCDDEGKGDGKVKTKEVGKGNTVKQSKTQKTAER